MPAGGRADRCSSPDPRRRDTGGAFVEVSEIPHIEAGGAHRGAEALEPHDLDARVAGHVQATVEIVGAPMTTNSKSLDGLVRASPPMSTASTCNVPMICFAPVPDRGTNVNG